MSFRKVVNITLTSTQPCPQLYDKSNTLGTKYTIFIIYCESI